MRIVKTSPGCVHQPGQVLSVNDRVAQNWIRQKVAVPLDVVVELPVEKPKKGRHPRTGEDVTSIVIPCHNQPRLLQRCIDSIKRNTDKYELILVDNGATPEVKKVIADSRMKTVRSPTNLGFPRAVNLGIIHSRGSRILLLNDDTVVTPGWLDTMVAGLKDNVGLIGPTTNYSTGKQCVKISADNFRLSQRGNAPNIPDSEINSIAAKFTGGYKGVDRLSGFCLLIDRRVISEIGFFDPVFGMGSAEEMDFEDRAKRKGWRIAWAQGSYVHHFGHQTLKHIYNDIQGNSGEPYANHQLYEKRVLERERGTRGVVVPFFSGIPLLFPTWGRLEYSKVALDTLLRNTEGIQVVMIDDGSKDGTREWINSLDDPRIVSKIYRKKRQGLDRNMDLFFSITAGVEWVGKIDNDTLVPPKWLETLRDNANAFKVDVIAPVHFNNVQATKKYLTPSKKKQDGSYIVYMNYHVGGLGLIRRSWLDEVLAGGMTCLWERYGITPGGWTHLQESTHGKKAFCPHVEVKLLDSVRGSGEDYPEYNRVLHNERVKKYGRPPEPQ